MGDRALAHIEKVVSIYGIDGADKVEMCQVLDYHVVVGKGEFKVGEFVVYIEVDSILPDGLPLSLQSELDILKKSLKKATGENIAIITQKISEIISQNVIPEFEFLRQKKFIIKAMKLGKLGVISQGIIFGITILPPEIIPVEGLDVTELLNITKVIEDLDEVNDTETFTKKKKSKFENFLDHHLLRYPWYRRLKKEIKGVERKGVWESWMPPKTDEENVQKLFSKVKEQYGNDEWTVTNKIEGQSSSFYVRRTKKWFGFKEDIHFGVCSRTRHMLNDDGSRFWQTARELEIENKLIASGLSVMISGEHAGGKIQGNIYKLQEHHVYVFRVWDIDNQRVYTFDEMVDFCKKWGFETVPIIDRHYKLPDTVQELLTYSNGTDELVPGVVVMREGVVLSNDKVHFKVKNPEYLVFHGK